MQRHWSEQELETYWSFSSDELTLIPHRDASSRLGVAASLKFFQLEGFTAAFGDRALWNILAFCVVLSYTSPIRTRDRPYASGPRVTCVFPQMTRP
jgi:Domain of unknown function (DUF4158)